MLGTLTEAQQSWLVQRDYGHDTTLPRPRGVLGKRCPRSRLAGANIDNRPLLITCPNGHQEVRV